MVTMRNQSTMRTPMLSRRQSLAHSMAALRAILRRVARIHFDHFTTGAFSLALKRKTTGLLEFLIGLELVLVRLHAWRYT